jgi:hypothetical protein
MNERELNRERRRQRALERLGTNTPRCVACGHNDPHALELHHIAGDDFGDDKGAYLPQLPQALKRLAKGSPAADI